MNVLAADCGVQAFRQRRALDVDPAEGVINPAKIIGGQVEVSGGKIVVEMRDRRSAGDGDDPEPLCQEPGKGDPGRRRALAGGEIAKEVDQFEISLQRLGREAREILSQSYASSNFMPQGICPVKISGMGHDDGRARLGTTAFLNKSIRAELRPRRQTTPQPIR